MSSPSLLSVIRQEAVTPAFSYTLGEYDAPAEKTLTSKDYRWRITRIRGTPAALLGHVYAPDEKTALERAAEEFHVQPELRNRLVAQREKE